MTEIEWSEIMKAALGPFSSLVIVVIILGFLGFGAWRIIKQILPVVIKKIEETNDWKTTFENISDKANVMAENISKMEGSLSGMSEAFREFRVETKEVHTQLQKY